MGAAALSGTATAEGSGRHIVWIASALVAITRWPALSRTLWDWDEALFALAVRDYDVRLYHPQPPGFPLFIALAKAMVKLVPFHDEFHALQAIVFVASLFVFPAAYFLARELGASFFVAFGSALVLAFMPNVWFYGGTAFSDVPSLVLSLFACALLLRGRRDTRALLAGAIVLGIAAGFRPQNLLIGLVPFVLGVVHSKRRIAAVLLLAIILIASYGGAAIASGGWSSYRDALREHEHYIRTTDSFLAPIRPSLIKVADDFFLRPFRAPAINIVLALLALIALARRRAHVLLALAIFGPFAIFAWLYLDFHSTSRFSIAYMPLIAIFAAEGIDALRRFRAIALAALIALLIVWTWPALTIVHRTISPPIAALQFAPNALIDDRLGAHAAYLRRESNPNARVIVREGRGAVTFARDRARLAGIARDRYFEVSVAPR
ncbi:MAG: hypothetical protein DMF56_13235 [Acidobacteria bacterium]|nr:MAG: hypothetical protein DMF56_13235 [Acidobacteriota bacterium]